MSRRTLLIVRWGIFFAACVFLYLRLAKGQDTPAAWGNWVPVLGSVPGLVWAALLAMALLNWGIEAAKWRWLVAPLEPVGMGRAFSATLAGTAAGLATPNRTGEPLGRVLFLAPGNRWKGGFATALGSIAQFVTTLLVGALALVAWYAGGSGPGWPVAVVVAGIAAASLALYFRPRMLRRLLHGVPGLRGLHKATAVLEECSTRKLLGVWLMSMARYVVFALQYMLLLGVLASVGWADAAMAVPLIYLMTTLVPSVMLTELGIRGSVAVALLAPLGGQPALVLLASFGVWAANIALPAIAGAVIILVARIHTRA